MKILVACERFGRVRDAFRARGHDAYSCDTEPDANGSPYHYRQDVLPLLEYEWNMLLAFPPCTYLCVSGIHWNSRVPGRREKTEEALAFVFQLMRARIPRIAIENPAGIISTRICRPRQYIQPWQFGEPYSKMTGLWLKGLPNLVPTNILEPEAFQQNGRPRWRNQTGTGQNRLGPSPTRAAERGRTYAGIAAAMAEQWG